MTTFGFQEQLKKGLEAQEQFKKIYGEELVDADTRDYDFVRPSDGKRVELKTEFKELSKTPNFFFERHTLSRDNVKNASIWQSADKADVVIWYFPKSNTYFEFNLSPKDLCPIVQAIIDDSKLPMYVIKNKGFEGHGFCVPRSSLKQYFTEVKVSD